MKPEPARTVTVERLPHRDAIMRLRKVYVQIWRQEGLPSNESKSADDSELAVVMTLSSIQEERHVSAPSLPCGSLSPTMGAA